MDTPTLLWWRLIARAALALSLFITATSAIAQFKATQSQTANNLPREFMGVWLPAGVGTNECKKDDWKGVGGSGNPELISVSPRSIEEYESGCRILNITGVSHGVIGDQREAEVTLACSGYDMKWQLTELWHVHVFASAARNPDRDKLIVLLSVKAGLRAGEIAKLTWDMVAGPSGEIGAVIELRDCIAKKHSGRLIPVHPQLRTALAAWRKMTFGSGPIIRSEHGGAMRPVSIVNWFALAYQAVGLKGCSSHSGRRTFITRAARLVHKAGGSLRDVQLLAGHRSIQTTQRYIDGDSDAQRKLVSMI